jgi:hypothetical protein
MICPCHFLNCQSEAAVCLVHSIKILYGFHLDVFVLSPSSLPRSSSLPSTVLFKLKQSPARSAGSYLPTFKFKKIWTMYYNMSASKGLDPVLPKPHLNYRLRSFNSERKAEFPLCHPLYKIKHICPKPFQNPLISSSADLPNFVDALSIQLPSQPLHFGAKWKRMPGCFDVRPLNFHSLSASTPTFRR